MGEIRTDNTISASEANSEQKGENVRYVKHRNKWFYLGRTAEANVIAWCETPKYTEE